jgi:hypothetical protein
MYGVGLPMLSQAIDQKLDHNGFFSSHEFFHLKDA